MRNKLISVFFFFFYIEARDPHVLFSACRQTVPGLGTRRCLSLPAHTLVGPVPGGCYVSALQLSSFQGYCLWRRGAEMLRTTLTIKKWYRSSNLLGKNEARARLSPTVLFS